MPVARLVIFDVGALVRVTGALENGVKVLTYLYTRGMRNGNRGPGPTSGWEVASGASRPDNTSASDLAHASRCSPPPHNPALSSSCTGASTFVLFVSMMHPFITISSRMKCAFSRLNMISSSHCRRARELACEKNDAR